MRDDRYANLLKRVEKPGRYTGGEFGETLKAPGEYEMRMCFCFPDTYEIGMSNLGIKILTGVCNSLDYMSCEHTFAPWVDMEAVMRETQTPLFALESGDPVSEFDIIAFTLQYELSYSNMVNMLELGGIPLYSADRNDSFPLIIAGGPCTYNPEPVADFIDVIVIGEGEEAIAELCDLYREYKKSGMDKAAFLRKAASAEGFYVPSMYDVGYNDDGTIKYFEPKFDDVPRVIRKRIIRDLDKVYFPTSGVIPYIETIHDRTTLEIFRGCIRGCRFCQAGYVYRPYREKSPEILNQNALDCINNTGYNEISLSSLSISDYSKLPELIDKLLEWTEDRNINLSLPSMRIDAFYGELMRKVMSVRKSGLTFAPEAGSQRLRDVINKNITEDEIMTAVAAAFDEGRTSLKLYFMNGLPTERDEDIKAIAALAQKIVDEYYSKKRNGKFFNVTVSLACFVPKPFTPFQWCAQDSFDELIRKQRLLRDEIKTKKISYNYHEAKISFIEAVFARGDRRLSAAVAEANRRGQRFDGWDEFFNFNVWLDIFKACGIDPNYYANRKMDYDEILPWDHIDCGVDKEFLINEAKLAAAETTAPSCRQQCSGCGANRLGGIKSCCPSV